MKCNKTMDTARGEGVYRRPDSGVFFLRGIILETLKHSLYCLDDIQRLAPVAISAIANIVVAVEYVYLVLLQPCSVRHCNLIYEAIRVIVFFILADYRPRYQLAVLAYLDEIAIILSTTIYRPDDLCHTFAAYHIQRISSSLFAGNHINLSFRYADYWYYQRRLSHPDCLLPHLKIMHLSASNYSHDNFDDRCPLFDRPEPACLCCNKEANQQYCSSIVT